MRINRTIPLALVFILLNFFLLAQNDTVKHKVNVGIDSNSVLSGVIKNLPADNNLIIGGYVSSYYAWYSDETIVNGFVQFPTVAPRNKQFGLNMALISMKYDSQNFRGKLGIHFGDIPQTVWPTQFNMIQEANAGFRIYKGLWFDGGFFRSHIGIESTQPRENLASSMALADNFEPYYFAGAKLTWVVNKKVAVQANVFNSFNTFVDNNENKLLGLSLVLDPSDKFSLTYNFLTGDETPDSSVIKHQRYYNDLYATVKLKKLTLGFEANYGWQENSDKKDSAQSATVMSGLIVARYQFMDQLCGHVRGEYFSDPEQALTGNIAFGNYVYGTTLGLEFIPYKGITLTLEGRILQSENLMFREGNYRTNQRYELHACLDISF